MRIDNQRGIALVVTLFFSVVLYALSGLILFRVVNESKTAKLDRDGVSAFYSAQAGAQAALNQLNTWINTDLTNTISGSNPSGVISLATSKVSSGDGIGWLVYSVRENNIQVLTQTGEEVNYNMSATVPDAGSYQNAIVITEKTDPVSAGLDAWDFPFSYRVKATGTFNGQTREVLMTGDFTVRVQRDNFAKFALFTNTQTTPNGDRVWFTDKTNFSGPVFTNDRLNFALNPSGTFNGLTKQVQSTARFYNNGSSILLNADSNGTRDVPVFNEGFQRSSPAITLSSSVQKQNMIDEAKGTGGNYNNNGIYVPANGSTLKGGIYVKGNSTIVMSVDGGNNAVYTIQQGATTKTITVDRTTSQTIVNSGGTNTTYSGLPDGVDNVGTLIYVDGAVTSLRGTVQSATELTIASTNDIIIADHVRYADYTPAVGTPGTAGYVPPSAEGKTNLLGLVTWEGNVRVGNAAPNNIDMHGTVLARNGVFQVDDYDEGTPRGTATLLGGMISDDYGGFGQFNGATGQQTSGYGRNFVYDTRMEQGKAPPYFPSLNTFIAFTNDLTDKLVWQEGK